MILVCSILCFSSTSFVPLGLLLNGQNTAAVSKKKQQFSITEMTKQQNEGYDVTIDDYEVIN